ncbi:hypothetical protein J3R82DRAFT_6739, partial [Butyriboletus roseoflavus]
MSHTTHLSAGHRLVQYSCEPEKVSGGEIRTHCFPFSRIFRICPHRPALEVTRYITIDAKTGEIEIPDEPRFVLRPFPNYWWQDDDPWNSSLLKGKPWRDVHLYGKSDH